jgi:hypothetical protein
MSNSKGRCFRSQRRLKRRKERQAAAVVELRRRNPSHHVFAQERPGRRFEVGMLAERGRELLMRGFNQLPASIAHRRGGRRGS